MSKLASLLIFAILGTTAATLANAFLMLPPPSVQPRNPTSADNLKFFIYPLSCDQYYKDNAYAMSMVENKITVTLGEVSTVIQSGCRQSRVDIDLGRLPAGNYTLTVKNRSGNTTGSGMVENLPFTVSDARVVKQKPWVNLDYSGMWWDPTDSGSGLFIWQDAVDNTFAAWFTYSAEGTPYWYVFQPKWETASATFTTDLLQTSRKPGATIPPPNPTSNTIVGTAKLDLTHNSILDMTEEGELTITLKGQSTRVIKIQRFKP
jgi:hypothetical protein